MIIVIDFGSQLAHLIARRVRELNVYSELLPHYASIDQILEKEPNGIIFSGGPKSVYEPNAPLIDEKIFDLNIPILGICYGHHLIAKYLGGTVSRDKGEYGETHIFPVEKSVFLNGIKSNEIVWMSHADFVEKAPKNFTITSYSENQYISSMECPEKKIYSVQFHPEVVHTPKGKEIIANFLKISNCPHNWHLDVVIDNKIKEITEETGGAKVLCAVSGGVDSTVTAELFHKAIGNNLYCIFVNNGLLRSEEYEEVCTYFQNSGFNFHPFDASKHFLSKLQNIRDPEQKRRIIGETFIEIFEQKAKEFGIEEFKFLGQGTIYPDRIESAQPSSQASLIKTHHNVGGLPKKMGLRLIEPLKDLYKDEVRKIGILLGINQQFLNRHPFPGPGLAIRIVGEISEERIKIVQESDKILAEELKKDNIFQNLWQAFTAFLDVQTVGVMGDSRSYQYPIIIRCVESMDAMTANAASIPIDILRRIASRIVNEVKNVNRVFYDLTDKPPATIEYE